MCFFFKQKTAYDMRISDWSSDVCSSDLFDVLELGIMTAVIYLEQTPGETVKRVAGKHASRPFHIPMDEGGYTQEELTDAIDTLDQSGKIIFGGNFTASSWPDIRRSEENTSDLQSLIRISYAVFSLK